jgi:hypothetical protein
MKILFTLIFLLICNSIINAQEIQRQLSFTLSKKTFSKIFLETGDFINQLNQKESYFKIVLQKGVENVKVEKHVIMECIGNKNRDFFYNDCKDITNYLGSLSSLDYSKTGILNNFKYTASNNFEAVKIQNLDSNKSIVLNSDEFFGLYVLLIGEDVKRDNNYK